ncbi:unnamed protein product [Closterium sp. NIES-65]|nr:unnamed protein product [Closterium sp. NIES-65]
MADLHCEFASLGVDNTTAHNHSFEAHKNESHEAPIAASSAAGEDGVDDLFARLSRDIREAKKEQQRLDAIVSTLFAANAMCFWPDSDAHRPQRAFGFRVLRTLPPAAETLEMRGEPAGGLAVVSAAPCQRELSAAVAQQQLCQSLASIRSCHPLPIPHAHPHIPSPPIPFPPARFPPVPFPPSPPSHAHHRPHSMLARTFFLMERSNERAPSSPDWESLGVVKSLGAQSARVNVLPHLLPWLSASATASLRHGSCATLLDYHSTQTKFEGTNVHSSLCPPSPPSLVAATVFYPVSLISSLLPVLSAWEFYLCKPLPLCRRSTLPQAPSPSSRLRPLTLVYVPDSKLPSPHRPPAALATAPALAPSTPPSPSSYAVVPLSPTPALVALDITPIRASPRLLPSRLTSYSLIRDIISFVSQRASTNAAKEGLLNASVQELADTDVHGLSDEYVKELNCMLKTWGVDADAKQLDTVVDEYGRTAVHVAARDGDIFVVQVLLGLGMLVSVRCNNRSTPMHRGTPLHDAARQGKWEAVKWLAQQGIDPQEVETNPSPGCCLLTS